MSARENILARIRTRQGRAAAPRDDEVAAVAAHVAAHPRSPRPRSDGDLAARFRERALNLATTVEDAATPAAVPAMVAQYLHSHRLPPTAVCWPALGTLDWAGSGITVAVRAARGDDPVGITGAYCAIAETGTLMLLSGAQTPATVSLLPETHIAVVSRSRIVAGMEEAWALLRSEHGQLPRAVNFVSGPSRTADIEQTVTLGAHGPYRVHLILTP